MLEIRPVEVVNGERKCNDEFLVVVRDHSIEDKF
jgi:hypothetical protein